MNPYKEHALKLDKAFKRARANYLEAFAELTEAKEPTTGLIMLLV